jgi:uncharacterized protein (DUF2141 family)
VVGLNSSVAEPTYNAAEDSYGDIMEDPIVSADGNLVGFITNADNFAPNTAGVAGQLYLRDLAAGTTTLVSANQARTGGGVTLVNNGSNGFQGVTAFALSDDASTVAFTSNQDDLVDNEYLVPINVFIYQKTVTNPTTGSIVGEVFNDLNGDGTPEAGEAGIAGVTVYIDSDSVGHYVFGDPTATTNSSGDYTFIGLDAGMYTIGEVIPLGTRQTNPPSSGLGTVTVTAGQASTGPDFGLQTLPADLTLGAINGPGDLSSPVVLATTATSSSYVGLDPITATGAASSNYSITYGPGAVALIPAPLIVTVVDVIKVFGVAVPTLTVTYSGFVNGDGPSSLVEPVTLTTSATADSTTGIYAIIASGGYSSDYSITYVNGALADDDRAIGVEASVDPAEATLADQGFEPVSVAD